MDCDCLWGGVGDGVGVWAYSGYVIRVPRIEDAWFFYVKWRTSFSKAAFLHEPLTDAWKSGEIIIILIFTYQ